MTNNPTIDGVCKTCLGSGIEYDGAGHTCTACNGLGGVPAVERQELAPMPEMVDRRGGWPEGYLESDNDWRDNNPEAVSWLAENHAAIRHALYNTSPEVDALQSTIAQLQARVAVLEQDLSNEMELSGGRKALIAELESGRGELVGRVSYIGSGFVRVRTTQCLAMEQPLFTAPPASVSVSVDLRKRLNDVWLFLDGQTELNGCVWGEKPEGRHAYWWRKELRAVIEDVNACLDATAAMNEKSK